VLFVDAGVVLDIDGTISAGIDPVTGMERLLRPSDGGAYRMAALAADNVVGALGNLSVPDLGLVNRNFTITADALLAPFAIVNTGKIVHRYFEVAVTVTTTIC
jgi:hypothetical protein